MERATLDGIELEFESRGGGDLLALIHPGHFDSWFRPLMDEPALAERYRLIIYPRVGCAGSSPVTNPVSLAQAPTAVMPAADLGIRRGVQHS